MIYINEWGVYTLRRVLKTRRLHRETLRRSSSFMMPVSWGKVSSVFSTRWVISCPNFALDWKDSIPLTLFLTPNAPSNSRYIRRVKWDLETFFFFFFYVNWEERATRRVTRGSISEEAATPLIICPPTLLSVSPTMCLHKLFGLRGRGCLVMQKWQRVIPHSCHNLATQGEGMHPWGPLKDYTKKSCQVKCF